MTHEVFRDAWGIPHVRASSLDDLAFGQGFVAARDRPGQIELERLRSLGATAATLGEDALSWDCFARRALIDETARLCFGRLDAETRTFCESYVAGVNAGLDSTEWQPWTPLGIFLVQHILFATFPTKLWQRRLAAALGPDAVELFGREAPALSGSNAWAVGGGRTASGEPLIGGDPHRVIEAPGVYQQVHLACPEFDVIGFAFPGVPGIAHFAHAGDVAWAITNAMADYQDLCPETLRRSGSGVEALGREGWYAVEVRHEVVAVAGAEDVEIEVITTRNGPVIIGGPHHAESLSLRTASYVSRDLGFGAFLPLLRARTVEEVSHAFDRWVEPVNNVVIADRSGAVRYRVAGRVPERSADGWTGWIGDLPVEFHGPHDQVVTANERRGPESSRIGSWFAPAHRARRIHQLLDGRDGLGVADFAEIHGDTALLPASSFKSFLSSLEGLTGEALVLRDRIVAWDGRMDASSQGAAVFAAWRSAFVRVIAAQPVFAALREPSPYPDLFDPWLDLTSRVASALESFIADGSPFGLDLRGLAAEALSQTVSPEVWGDTHTFKPVGGPAPAIPLDGDSDCVRCNASLPGLTDDCSRGSVARYVWDLADRDNSGWIVPLGAAEDPTDPHYADQFDDWAACRLIPVVTDWNLLAKGTP